MGKGEKLEQETVEPIGFPRQMDVSRFDFGRLYLAVFDTFCIPVLDDAHSEKAARAGIGIWSGNFDMVGRAQRQRDDCHETAARIIHPGSPGGPRRTRHVPQ
jgi:hypothetical protein